MYSAICDITLNITDLIDDTLTLDISDDLSTHLARGSGGEARFTHLSQGAGNRYNLFPNDSLLC